METTDAQQRRSELPDLLLPAVLCTSACAGIATTTAGGAPVAPGALLALQRLAGNQAVAGALQPRTRLEADFNGDFALAAQSVVRLWDSAGVFANDTGRLQVKSGNLLGSGSNDTVRAWIAGRPLGEIGIPKVIRMNGSLGRGLQDHQYDISVWARGSGQRMTNDPVSRFMGGAEQRITRVGGTRWGPTWLAAYHLGLQDLDRDDPRVTSANIMAGAQKVWDNIKDRSISSLGGSVGHSTW